MLEPSQLSRQPQAQRRDADQQTEPEDIGDQEGHDAPINLPKWQITAHAMQNKHINTERRRDHAELQYHTVNNAPPDGVIAHAVNQWVDDRQSEHHGGYRVEDGAQREVEEQEHR